MKEIRKILIMKFRNIGDVLLSTPLISQLARIYPKAKIHFALNDGTQAVLEQNPYIEKLHIYQRERIKKGGFLARLKAEFAYFKSLKNENFDLIIQSTSGERGIILGALCCPRALIAYKSKNAFLNRFITHFLPAQGLRHSVICNLDAIKILNYEPTSAKVSIYFDDFSNFFSAKNALPANFIHMHAMSRWLFKCASDEINAQIIDFCELELGIKVVLTCANDEKEIQKSKQILNLAKAKPLSFLGTLNLKQVAFLSSKSRLFIGADTAIMHIAAAVDTPVIALFGPSGAMHWGPWDNSFLHSAYTQKNGLQNMGKHSVIQHSWDCVPCGKDGCDGSKISRCLNELDIKIIKNKIAEKIAKF